MGGGKALEVEEGTADDDDGAVVGVGVGVGEDVGVDVGEDTEDDSNDDVDATDVALGKGVADADPETDCEGDGVADTGGGVGPP